MDQVSRALLMAGGAVEATDSQFSGVTMLLKGDGTNGAQNNTFVDASTNNFTITRTGNVTQGTFTPYGANWSNYFDGSGDYLVTPNNAAFDFGTGDFTIECFACLASGNAFAMADGAGDDLIAYQGLSTSNGGKFVVYYPGIGNFTSTPVTLNSWLHVAVSRSSGTLRVFMNGVLIGSPTSDSKNWTSNRRLHIGTNSALSNPAAGYISNVRVLKGTALYTSTFTPPTAPLTAITNTSLLTCQSNRFIDNSANNFTITRNGDVSVQRFSPFNPTAAYSAGTIGGSGYFDGSGDYLVPSTSFPAFTGDFTVELYVYRTLSTNQGDFISLFRDGTSGIPAIQIYSGTTGTVVASLSTNGSSQTSVTYANIATEGQWHHIALTRSGTTVRLFVNGVIAGTTPTVSGALYSGSTTHYIGFGAFVFQGYLSGLRVLQGTALYTANFTPPTAPLTAITNTSLLLNFTNAGVIDNAMMNDLETVGNAQISTTQSKWGGSSIALDGSGDALSTPANINLAFETGDFTIEMWVYGSTANNSSTVGGGWPRFFVLGTSQTAGCIESYVVSGGTIYVELFGSGSLTFTASTLLNSTWNHFAVTRSGTTLRLFVNGTQQTSGTFSTNLNLPATSSSWIGAVSASVGNFNGYIDDLRITKGYARYTANFTPPDSLPTR